MERVWAGHGVRCARFVLAVLVSRCLKRAMQVAGNQPDRLKMRDLHRSLLIERFEWIRGGEHRAEQGCRLPKSSHDRGMNGERSSWTGVVAWGNGSVGRPESTQNAKSFPGAGTFSKRQEEKPANPEKRSGPGQKPGAAKALEPN